VDHVNDSNAPCNDIENAHEVENPTIHPSTTNPPSTTIQGASSMKKINAIRGWKKEDMLGLVDDIEFRGYSVDALVEKYGIASLNIHY